MKLIIYSFGYKYGPPEGVNLLLDVRMLPNPYWDEKLRPYTGRDQAVADYVLESEAGRECLSLLLPLFEFYVHKSQEKKDALMVAAIGCTGGRHRSVAIVEKLAGLLSDSGLTPIVFHRDIGKDSR